MADYVPRKDNAFNEWLDNLTRFCDTHGAEVGLPADVTAALDAAREEWQDAYAGHLQAQTRARSAAAAKQEQRKTSAESARRAVRILQASPLMTDAFREMAGVTIPDAVPTPFNPELIRMQEPPLVLLDWSIRSTMVIHFGQNPANEHENPLPPGMIGARIWSTDKGRDARECDWTFLADCRRSPYIHKVNNGGAITITYRVQYIDREFATGVFSAPAAGTVSA